MDAPCRGGRSGGHESVSTPDDHSADVGNDTTGQRSGKGGNGYPRPVEYRHAHPAGGERVLRTFIVDGRLTQVPAVPAKRRVVLEHIVASFEPGIRYPDATVNAVLRAWFTDHAALRRYLVDEDLLGRAAGEYWRTGGYVEV